MLSGRRGVYRLVLSGPSDASHVHDHFGAGAWHGGRLRGCAARGPRVLAHQGAAPESDRPRDIPSKIYQLQTRAVSPRLGRPKGAPKNSH